MRLPRTEARRRGDLRVDISGLEPSLIFGAIHLLSGPPCEICLRPAAIQKSLRPMGPIAAKVLKDIRTAKHAKVIDLRAVRELRELASASTVDAEVRDSWTAMPGRRLPASWC